MVKAGLAIQRSWVRFLALTDNYRRPTLQQSVVLPTNGTSSTAPLHSGNVFIYSVLKNGAIKTWALLLQLLLMIFTLRFVFRISDLEF